MFICQITRSKSKCNCVCVVVCGLLFSCFSIFLKIYRLFEYLCCCCSDAIKLSLSNRVLHKNIYLDIFSALCKNNSVQWLIEALLIWELILDAINSNKKFPVVLIRCLMTGFIEIHIVFKQS